MKIKTLFLIFFSVVFIAVSYGQKNNKKIIITGTITDINQLPVAGASIFVDNQSTGKVTNNKGF
jgi:hypothetical protein